MGRRERRKRDQKISEQMIGDEDYGRAWAGRILHGRDRKLLSLYGCATDPEGYPGRIIIEQMF
jgi:hypothetical protein